MKKDKILGIQELAGTDLWEPIVSIYSQLHVLKYHIELAVVWLFTPWKLAVAENEHISADD